MRYKKLILLIATACIFFCGCSNEEITEPKETLREDNKPSQELCIENSKVLDNLPEFTFTSGVGGWLTNLNINSDGTFTGKFMDSEMGVRGEEYPEGTAYICNFSGKFSDIEAVDEYTYSLHLERLELEKEKGIEWIEDGIRYIAAGPYGMEGSSEFTLFLPGKSIDELPEEYLSWVGMALESENTLPFYGLYNVTDKKGFSSQKQE